MLSHVDLQQVACFETISVPVAPLTILTGNNDSGKSAFIQSLLVLRQQVLGSLSIDVQAQLTPEFVDWLHPAFDTGMERKFRVITKSGTSVTLTVDPATALAEKNTSTLILPEIDSAQLRDLGLFSESFSYLPASANELAHPYVSLPGFIQRIAQPERLHPQAKSQLLQHQLTAWASEIYPGLHIASDAFQYPHPPTHVQFSTPHGKTHRLKTDRAGSGLVRTLQLLIMALTAQPGQLLIIENPERNLHPKAQAILGQLLALTVVGGTQVIVETHSDHFINAIRVAVRQKQVLPEHVAINFFDRPNRQSPSSCFSLRIQGDGRIAQHGSGSVASPLPTGFIDTWGRTMSSLL